MAVVPAAEHPAGRPVFDRSGRPVASSVAAVPGPGPVAKASRTTEPGNVSSLEDRVHAGSVDLLVADCAVLESGASQVVKRRRHSTEVASERQIRMTLEAQLTHV